MNFIVLKFNLQQKVFKQNVPCADVEKWHKDNVKDVKTDEKYGVKKQREERAIWLG